MRETNKKIREEIAEALDGGMSAVQIAEMLTLSYANVSQYIGRMVDEGLLERVGRGVYRSVRNDNGKHTPAAAVNRRVDLPAYMKTREPITLFIEKSPVEIEGVMRFEIQTNGQWFALPILDDLRVCTGEDIPRWSATQETYYSVSAYRVTMRNGEQSVYQHNLDVPFTVDAK